MAAAADAAVTSLVPAAAGAAAVEGGEPQSIVESVADLSIDHRAADTLSTKYRREKKLIQPYSREVFEL